MRNNTYITFLKIYGPAVFWGMFILVATLTPGKSLPSSSLFQFDKLIHIIIFGVFAWLVLRSFFLSGAFNHSNKIKISIRVACATILFGILIEGMQEYIPDRGADRYDVIANTVGIILFQLIFYVVYRNKKIEV